MRSATCALTGVPETANEDSLGISETICLSNTVNTRPQHARRGIYVLSLSTANHLHLVHDDPVPFTHDQRAAGALVLRVRDIGTARPGRGRASDAKIVLEHVVGSDADVKRVHICAPIYEFVVWVSVILAYARVSFDRSSALAPAWRSAGRSGAGLAAVA